MSGHGTGLTLENAGLQQIAGSLQGVELFVGEEGVIDAVHLAGAWRTGCHGHRAKIHVVSNRVLKFMVNAALWEPGRQVLAQVPGQRACRGRKALVRRKLQNLGPRRRKHTASTLRVSVCECV